MIQADNSAVEALDREWCRAIVARDWRAFASLYAHDAVLMPPNSAVVAGPTAIAEWFANSGVTIQHFTTRSEDVEGDGSFAANRGSYVLTFRAPGLELSLTERGKYVWTLRRHDGAWRIVTDIWNSDAPPA
jgi:uncharacterized protein (TIGR02246 family)